MAYILQYFIHRFQVLWVSIWFIIPYVEKNLPFRILFYPAKEITETTARNIIVYKFTITSNA